VYGRCFEGLKLHPSRYNGTGDDSATASGPCMGGQGVDADPGSQCVGEIANTVMTLVSPILQLHKKSTRRSLWRETSAVACSDSLMPLSKGDAVERK